MTVKDLKRDEYEHFYQGYINKTIDIELREGLKINRELVLTFLRTIPSEKYEFRYDVGKWTIKEIILHLIDTERIFGYRALRFARQDQTTLEGFDQDIYVIPSKANGRSFENLLNEYEYVRRATISLFESFDEEMLLTTGTANNSVISVRAIGFIIMGHENHHCDVIKQRYL